MRIRRKPWARPELAECPFFIDEPDTMPGKWSSAFVRSQPIWLESNIQEFKRHSRTRFRQDNFMEQIDFDYFEIQIIEED